MALVTGGVLSMGSGIVLAARISGNDGQPITQSTLSTIAYTVADLTDGDITGTGTFTVSSVVFDSLQQGDHRWHLDSKAQPGEDGLWGYNFLATLPASLFGTTAIDSDAVLTPTTNFQCDVLFTPASGQPWVDQFFWTGRKTWASS